MYVSLYNKMSLPITSGNMHTQIDKCAYVRNHGHNNMGCGHAPHGGACPHASAQGHTFTFANVSVFHGGNCSFFTGTMDLL